MATYESDAAEPVQQERLPEPSRCHRDRPRSNTDAGSARGPGYERSLRVLRMMGWRAQRDGDVRHRVGSVQTGLLRSQHGLPGRHSDQARAGQIGQVRKCGESKTSEAPEGVEPSSEKLEFSALPLGDGAILIRHRDYHGDRMACQAPPG